MVYHFSFMRFLYSCKLMPSSSSRSVFKKLAIISVDCSFLNFLFLQEEIFTTNERLFNNGRRRRNLPNNPL